MNCERIQSAIAMMKRAIPRYFEDVKPEHVIEKLETLLDSYYEQQESKP